MEAFACEPLLPRQIRLLRVGIMQDNMSCEMTAHSLDEQSLRYAAISYTWGASLPAKTILLNNRPFSVTSNCWDALWQVRNNPTPAATVTAPKEENGPVNFFWIDSICINQTDLREKSQQIAQMGEIYSKAQVVAACVGQEDTDAPLFDQDFAWHWGSLTERQRKQEFDMIAGPIAHLLSRDYFHRLWTVQECLLAKDIHVYCGNKCVRWRMLRVQLRSAEMVHGGYTVRQDSQVLSDFFNDMDIFQTRGHSVQLSLADLINRYGGRACSDPRDKLYGLLSMAPAWSRRRIEPNYSKPLSQVFWEYAVASATYSLESGEIYDVPDVPASEKRGYSYQRDCSYALRSIALLGKAFLVSNDFGHWLERFWRWRLTGEGEIASAVILDTAAMELLHEAHCHRVNLSAEDQLVDLEEGWLDEVREQLSEYDKSFTVGAGTVSTDIRSADGCADFIAANMQSQPKLLELAVSSSWGDSGRMRFLVPSSIRTGDCLVSFGIPHRTPTYVVCRAPAPGRMPSRMPVVGFAKLVPHPDVEHPKVWPRHQSHGRVYLRPHDLIVVALMRDAGMEFLSLPISEPGDESFVTFDDGKFKDSYDAAEGA